MCWGECTWRCSQTIPTTHTGSREISRLYKRYEIYEGKKILTSEAFAKTCRQSFIMLPELL